MISQAKRKVGQLRKLVGIKTIKIYDNFVWRPAVREVAADEDNSVEDRDEIPGEDKHDLDTVLKKFDRHWGRKNYGSMKRQKVLDINVVRSSLSWITLQS